MFDKILIANRGEIACRVIATCHRLGIATVAVYSDADRDARHVRLADEAVRIGPAPAADSYLRGEAILEAARRTGAQAIHPGYGFLSENAGFARACAEAGIVFIGPPASAIDAMGDKSAAKALMQQAGVPLTPGYHGERQEPAFLRAQADAIGYPVLIKASAGGGGKGMRRVEASADFEAALASCQREAQSAFGNAHVLVEKYIERPRHIEIQVFGDGHGNMVHLFERDCSVQRRHQKVLEEAPAPGMSEARRAAMGQAAIDAARAVGYVGAGTVEFIAAPGGEFWFMEMNTRLQVEHPVTEMITGTDLVEWQLRVAAGQPLPRTQAQLRIQGHAIEARLYAEDADRGFLPSTGRLHHLHLPAAGAHVRVDAGVEQGDAITAYYDPMIAKLIVHDSTRERALQRLQQALGHCRALGVTTNADFLRRLVMTPAFRDADLDTALIQREHAALEVARHAPHAHDWALAAVLAASATGTAGRGGSPWALADGWRLGTAAPRQVTLQAGPQRRTLPVHGGDGHWQVRLEDDTVVVTGTVGIDAFALQVAGVLRRGPYLYQAGDLQLLAGASALRLTLHDPVADAAQPGDDDSGLLAPMPGRVVALLAEPGTRVARGTPLLVIEAMKMEHTLQAHADGVVEGYRVRSGDQVEDGAVLVDFQAADA
ncbi:acetyl-CoA carboxylase biotin carboxylase subunit [Stenotrophomonas mori]|uniref:Acetyl/propionyl/methylcrotonyl-CoA carboxylase subunit alpha n=1 Tax=Stenotrophomonas mori TaxID=2871096 RepID=A0ABT0SHJ7_9GAMM|nr:acetyl/propionyl/methylcrotonyl-CoA carboxylase subunit alpha [Stenotrophomonas mori]MCL7714538.1 acetyl/propionyl/methylcrotonyl-CoA carboxylase subunit alpha [Stenotrophomonas mori]